LYIDKAKLLFEGNVYNTSPQLFFGNTPRQFRRVDNANGSHELAPDDQLHELTTAVNAEAAGTAQGRLCPSHACGSRAYFAGSSTET
jgi:hypothetical protein